MTQPPRCINSISEGVEVFEFSGESRSFVAYLPVLLDITLCEICPPAYRRCENLGAQSENASKLALWN